MDTSPLPGPSRKRVKTLSPAGLRRASAELYVKVRASGFEPEYVVGIASGGVHVVDALGLPGHVPVSSVTLRRPSTATKQKAGLVAATLPRLPHTVLNRIRLWEDRFLSRKPSTPQPVDTGFKQELNAVSADIVARQSQHVLVVDDAVDSGATLDVVIEGLRAQLPPDVDVRAAVITTTRTPAQLVRVPEYSLFDMTLVRFPWSMDYKTSHP